MELQHFGWNMLTLGFVGTLLFTFAEGWGSWKQSKTIWFNESGQSVSIPLFTYLTFIFIATFIYGIATSSIALIFNGLLTLMQVPILLGLWKFKGFNKKEYGLLLILSLVAVAMIFSKSKDWFFLLISFGSIGFFLAQPWEIWKNKNSGAVEIKMIAAYFASTTFWVFYAFAIHDWVLQIICPSYLIILTATALLWYKYHDTEGKEEIPKHSVS